MCGQLHAHSTKATPHSHVHVCQWDACACDKTWRTALTFCSVVVIAHAIDVATAGTSVSREARKHTQAAEQSAGIALHVVCVRNCMHTSRLPHTHKGRSPRFAQPFVCCLCASRDTLVPAVATYMACAITKTLQDVSAARHMSRCKRMQPTHMHVAVWGSLGVCMQLPTRTHAGRSPRFAQPLVCARVPRATLSLLWTCMVRAITNDAGRECRLPSCRLRIHPTCTCPW